MKFSLTSLYFVTAVIVGSFYLVVSNRYDTMDVRKWAEIDRTINIKTILTRKLLIDPAYADLDSSGVLSTEELYEIYNRAGYDVMLIKIDSSVVGSALELPTLGIQALSKAVQSYESDLLQRSLSDSSRRSPPHPNF